MTHRIPSPALATSSGGDALPWIRVARDAPYFVTETGEDWTPIGQNDSIAWVDLAGLFARRAPEAAERYLADLKSNGVTCLRLMLEDAHRRHRYLERPAGRFLPNMTALWDTLFALCERLDLRILLTPFDTFWAWMRWQHHPYNSANGGMVEARDSWLTDRAFRDAVKARLTFAVHRWGGSGALFAWDLWNEIHPAHGGGSADGFAPFIADLSQHVRRLEIELYGRSHLQTVSLFGPELTWKPEMDLSGPIFRHPSLDFATVHIYEKGTIDHPRDTVAPALAMGRIVRESLAAIADGRPFLDTEHGPIHGFNDRGITLPEGFDDEYFRHMQWAHLASGGAGGGMRWPYRDPHRLTPGMRAAQRGLAAFSAGIAWGAFRRQPLDITVSDAPAVAAMGCGDREQAVAWCLRSDSLGRDGRLRPDAPPVAPRLRFGGFAPGRYDLAFWDTLRGERVAAATTVADPGGALDVTVPPFVADLALSLRRANA